MHRSFLQFFVVTCLAVVAGCDPCMNNPCDNGLACDGLETCTAEGGQAVCSDGTSVVCDPDRDCREPNGCEPEPTDSRCRGDNFCDDGDACTENDTCNPADGSCTGAPIDCDDGDPCTIDYCEANGGTCVNDVVDCSDGEFCNGEEFCDSANGLCTDAVSGPCNAGQICDEDTDTCPTGCMRRIQVNPGASVQVYSVTDPVPAGWTVVESSISDGGGFSSSEGEVRWLFFDGQSRTLAYELTSPASASGQACFEATANYNGDTEVTLPPQCLTPPCGS